MVDMESGMVDREWSMVSWPAGLIARPMHVALYSFGPFWVD
jgi:hypothetical protein